MKQSKLASTASYSLVQGATWGIYAVLLSFSSNVLYDFGFSDGQISLMLGFCTVGAFCTQLLVAELVNRFSQAKMYKVLMGMGALILVCSMILLMLRSVPVVSIPAFALSCVVLQGIPACADALGMDAIEKGSATNYSLARALGSLSYSIIAYTTGFLVRRFGTPMIPVMGILCGAALAVGALSFHLTGERGLAVEHRPKQKAEHRKGFLKQYPRYAAFLVGVIFINMSQNLVSNFMYQIMLSKSGGPAEQGISTAISAMVEIPVMVLFPLMMSRVRCDRWLRLAGIGQMIKPLGILLATAPLGVYLSQGGQMLGYGLFVISSANYARLVVGKGESVRAQGYLGAMKIVGGLIASTTGGFICQQLGVPVLVSASAVSAIIGGTIFLLTVEKTKEIKASLS